MTILDPTNLQPETQPIFNQLLKEHPNVGFIEAGPHIIEFENELLSIELTNPILLYVENDQLRIDVFNPELCGDGTFATVSQLIGNLKKQEDNSWYYTESDPNHEQIAKVILYSKLDKPHLMLDGIKKKIRREAEKTQKYNPQLQCKLPFFAKDHATIIMNKVSGVELFSIMGCMATNDYDLDCNKLLLITNAMLVGLKEFHARDGIHRDIKPENIIIDLHHYKATFIDNDYSCDKDKVHKKICIRGSAFFFPPETLLQLFTNCEQTIITQASDIFSLGRSIAELWGNISPEEFFKSDIDLEELHKYNQTQQFEGLFRFIDTPDPIQEKMENLLFGLTTFYPEDRLTLDDAIKQVEEMIDVNNHLNSQDCAQTLNMALPLG